MILRKLKLLFSDKGFWLTLILSSAVLIYFYGTILRNVNHTYFVTQGDGLQAYYGAVYHVKYDSSYWQMKGMNHPYGDEVFFTGCQPFVTNAIKLLSHIVDISSYTIGILNLIMLFSLVASAIVLYLLFRRFKLPVIYASAAATAIAFLSPQIERMAGHFSLTYEFAIPLFLYGLIRFFEAPSLRKSIWIAILVVFLAGTHMYFLGFIAMISFFYWLILYWKKHERFSSLLFCIKHFFIQTILPFVFLQILVSLLNEANDRTAYPWGFLVYKSAWDGVFFPFGKPYQQVFKHFYDLRITPEWEGIAYIGLAGVITFLILVVHAFFSQIKLSARIRDVQSALSHPLLAIFFWAAFFMMIYSFALPFDSRTWLIKYIGPLKQMRGIGRFNWVFFYVINIIAIIQVYQWTSGRKLIRFLACLFTVGIISYDAYYLNKGMPDRIDNKISILDDFKNESQENAWLKKVNPGDYQAMMVLPYFHIGSENIWMEPESGMTAMGFIYSMKTGLPLMNVLMSRVSLSQTYKNIQLVTEPYRPLAILTELKSDKPFLVLAKPDELNENQRRIFSMCNVIDTTPSFIVGELKPEKLRHLTDHLYDEAHSRFSTSKIYTHQNIQSTDSLLNFCFGNSSAKSTLNPDHSPFTGPINKYNCIFKDTVPGLKEGKYVISFRMKNFTTDLFPRTVIEAVNLNGADALVGAAAYHNCGKSYVFVDDTDALIEFEFDVVPGAGKIQLTLWNDDVFDKKAELVIYDLLIRPKDTDVYSNVSNSSITVNNRTYIKNNAEVERAK